MQGARIITMGLLVALAAAPLPAQPNLHATNTQNLGPLDGNPTLFAVMAAINAAGYDTDIDSPSNNPLRRQLRNFLSKQEIPSLPALRRFVRDHRKAEATADLSQYISFALLSKGAPDFEPANPAFPSPPEVAAMQGFAPLMAAFYREANVDQLWALSQEAYEVALSQYTEGVALAVQSVNTYLRNPLNPNTRGSFRVFVDLLGAPNQAHARVFLDEYFVVVTPTAEPFIEEIRHHYLRFWGDSLGFKYAPEIAKLKRLEDYALQSPLLGGAYREDFTLLATESFNRAVEARLDKDPKAAEQAMREGFILAPAFYEQLPAYEMQLDTLRNYFGDMLKNVSLRKEDERLAKVDWATERRVKVIRVTIPGPPPLTGVAKVLEDAEEAFRQDSYAAARDAWTGVLNGEATLEQKARATYGMARVAITDRDPEKADQLFRRVLEMSPDASTQSWSLVYLGKLADSAGEKEPAQGFYRQALAVAGLPEQVKREAEQGLAGTFFRPRPPEDELDDEEDIEDDDEL